MQTKQNEPFYGVRLNFYMEVFENGVPMDLEIREPESGRVLYTSRTMVRRHHDVNSAIVTFMLCKGQFTQDAYLRYCETRGDKLFSDCVHVENVKIEVPKQFLLACGYMEHNPWEGVFKLTERQHRCIDLAFELFHTNKADHSMRVLRALVPEGRAPLEFLQDSIHQVPCDIDSDSSDSGMMPGASTESESEGMPPVCDTDSEAD
jgi:hypothetical protein